MSVVFTCGTLSDSPWSVTEAFNEKSLHGSLKLSQFITACVVGMCKKVDRIVAIANKYPTLLQIFFRIHNICETVFYLEANSVKSTVMDRRYNGFRPFA